MRSRLMDIGIALTIGFGAIAFVSVQLGSPFVADYGSRCVNSPQAGDCPNVGYQAMLYSFLADGTGLIALAGIVIFVIGVVRARQPADAVYPRSGTFGPTANPDGTIPSDARSMACPRCGATVKMSDRFCGTCGFQGRE